MGISTSSLISELREHLGGLDSQEMTEASALLLLNRSFWEVVDKFPFRVKEITATFTTIAGTRSYGIPAQFDALRQLSILDPNTSLYTPLNRDSIHSHENERSTAEEEEGFPERYLREGNKIRLLPIPDDAYTVTIKYWASLSDLEAGNTPDLPQVWHEILLFGALWRGFLKLRDFIAAEQFKVQQIALINSTSPVEAKEEFDSHLAHLEVLGREYP